MQRMVKIVRLKGQKMGHETNRSAGSREPRPRPTALRGSTSDTPTYEYMQHRNENRVRQLIRFRTRRTHLDQPSRKLQGSDTVNKMAT